MNCTVYLLRHGEARPDMVRRYIGWTDVPLNENGRRQANWWRRKLSDIPFSRVISSDLVRTRETARIIGEGRNCPVERFPELREINLGSWEGLPMAEVRRLNPGEYVQRGENPASYRPEGGESFADLQKRVVAVFDRITAGAAGGNILLAGHAGVNRVLLCHLLGMPLSNLFRLGQDYGCLNIISCGADGIRLCAMNIPPGGEEELD